MDIYVVCANFFSFRPWSKRFLTKVERPLLTKVKNVFDKGQMFIGCMVLQ